MGNTINIGNGSNSVVIGGSVVRSSVVASGGGTVDLTVFDTAKELLETVQDKEARANIGHALKGMRAAVGTPSFAERYKEFVSSASGHLTIFSTVLGALANLAS